MWWAQTSYSEKEQIEIFGVYWPENGNIMAEALYEHDPNNVKLWCIVLFATYDISLKT